MNRENILAIIPARGSRDEVAHMNIRELGGHPLLYYTIKAALKSTRINRVIVSTEDEAVKDVSIQSGAEVPFLRPDYLCDGDITLAEVVSFTLEKLHTDEGYDCRIVVVLLPNAPFKTPEDIDKMIEHLQRNDYDSVIPLCQVNEFFWKLEGADITPANFDYRKKRIDTEPLYQEKGGIYVYKREVFSRPDKLKLGEKRGYYLISPHHAQTIHTTYDLFLLERLAKLPGALIQIIMEHE